MRAFQCFLIGSLSSIGWIQAATSPVSVKLNVASATINIGQAKDFSASVSNAKNTSVVWFVNHVQGGNATFGTIDAKGHYVTPVSVPSANVLGINAVSQADTTKSATASVTLLNAVPVIDSLGSNQINTLLPFTLIVNGKSFSPTATVVFDDHTSLMVTARTASQLTVTGKTSSPAGTKIHVTVTNPGAGATNSNAQTLTVQAPVIVTISPKTKTMRGLTAASFSAHIANNSNQAVTWSVNGTAGGNAALGTITTAGLYTAPSIVPSSVTVTATSSADASKADTAQVTLQNPVPFVSNVTSPLTAGPSVSLTVSGTGFSKTAQVTVASNLLAVTWINATTLKASGALPFPVGGIAAVQVSNPDPGAAVSNVFAVQVKNSGSKLSYSVAKRFLEQATWGPTPASIAHLQEIGIDSWIDEQFDPSKTPVSAYTLPTDQQMGLTSLQEQFFKNAVAGPDQLRQRVAFALGQIAVVSGVKLQSYSQMMPYQQMLLNDAFGTYRDFLKDVTLSPAMGHYLDMVNNDLPSAKYSPDENYAREAMQLFSIGLAQLNPDGTTDKPPVPTYTEDDVRALARVFTGWTYPACLGQSKWTNSPCFNAPMVAIEAHHDNDAKQVLGVTIQTGSAEGDLDAVLTAIESYHKPNQTVPNIAPFVALRLIQHLVTSNPAPDYVARISAVYVSSSGDLKRIVKAILEDPAAGNSDTAAPPAANEGHLREPVFFAVSILRALNAAVVYDPPLAPFTANMGQDLFKSPSVFNYYSPFYHLPGTPLLAPEFQLMSQAAAFSRANYVYRVVRNQISSDVQVDLSNLRQLASDTNATTQTASLTTLLNAVSQALLGSPMSTDMLNAILPALTATNDPGVRAATAVYLVAVSSRYQVEQ